MGFHAKLKTAWEASQSMLCVGLDPDPARFPASFQANTEAIYEFCTAIVDATADTVCAFKPQFAYFAAQRAEPELERLCTYIRETYPDVLLILDAKRGDIGPTAEQYAREAFDRYGADAVTVNPVPRHRLDRAVPALRRARGVRAVPHIEPGRRRLPIARRRGRAALRPRRPAGRNGVERDRRMRAGGRRDLPRRARHRAIDRRRPAGARSGRRRPGRRHRRDRRRRSDAPMASGW